MQVLAKHITGYKKLVIILAYMAVILIWSTTPLAIKWSSDGVSFLFGIVLRMGIGACIAVLLSLVFYKSLPFSKSALKVYAATAVALFGGMMPVYWGAQYISSGLISVIFGLTPIVTGYLAWKFAHEQSFTPVKVMGSFVGVTGLAAIFLQDGFLVDGYFYGVLAVLLAVFLHSISSVWIKRLKVELPAVTIVAGGLTVSMPLFIIVYLIFAPPLPETIPSKALLSIVYLGIVGSVIGFVCYYFLLKNLRASSVALITLVTPVMALWMGAVLNNEHISFGIYLGTTLVLLGLALHQWGYLLSKKLWVKQSP